MRKEKFIQDLRTVREKKCFPIINRGSFWYENLTWEQQVELREWYKKWLDVTITFKMPKKPKWLK